MLALLPWARKEWTVCVCHYSKFSILCYALYVFMVRISNSKECKVWTPPLLLERCGLIDGTYWQQRILLLKAADCIGLMQISRGACWVPEILYHLADSASQNVRRAPPRGRSSLHLTEHAHTTFVNFISDRIILRHFRTDRNDAFSVTLSHSHTPPTWINSDDRLVRIFSFRSLWFRVSFHHPPALNSPFTIHIDAERLLSHAFASFVTCWSSKFMSLRPLTSKEEVNKTCFSVY